MNAPLVAVGIGNTTVKLGLSSAVDAAGWPIWNRRWEIPTDEFAWSQVQMHLPAAQVSWAIASVQRAAEQQLASAVRAERPADEYRLLGHRDLPLTMRVDSPDRVGMDRLAAAVAVNRLRAPHRPAIFVDAGTALTVNLVAADGAFEGGAILPGFKLTTRALCEGTDLLPLVTADMTAEPPTVVGKSTETAIRSGLFWGSLGAVREIIERVRVTLPESPDVIVTGGDAVRLAEYVARDARFVPDLVLGGIVLSCS